MDKVHLDCVALYRNSLFLLQVHGIQNLILHVPRRKGIRDFKHPVGKSTLAMVNMGYDAKISGILHYY